MRSKRLFRRLQPSRVVRQWTYPTNSWVRPVRNLGKALLGFDPQESQCATSLTYGGKGLAVYDLNDNPMSFDFAAFLIAAERFFRARSCLHFDVCIVGRSTIAREIVEEAGPNFTPDKEEWRLQNVLVPLALLYGACDQILLVDSKFEIPVKTYSYQVYPVGLSQHFRPRWQQSDCYGGDFGQDLIGFRVPPNASTYVGEWLDRFNFGSPPVTLTMRSREFEPWRNTSSKYVEQLSDTLSKLNVPLIFIPETELGIDPKMKDHSLPVLREASWNMSLRLAIYSVARLNIYIDCGPALLGFGSPSARGLVFLPPAPDTIWKDNVIYSEWGLHTGSIRRGYAKHRFTFIFSEPTVAETLILLGLAEG